MKAITVLPLTPGSAAVEDVDEPQPAYGPVLVDAIALGICGTDTEIAEGEYGIAPEEGRRLVLGHESLGRVLEAPTGSGLQPGDLVAGIVRRPDPVPCACCAVGEWDMCRNDRYTERGIKGLHGFGSERWRIEPEFAVRVDPALGFAGVLTEPTSVVAKAWDQIERIAGRGCSNMRSVTVLGAGPIGLLAALLGAQRGLEVTVIDLAESGAKPDAVRGLGARYHAGPLLETAPSDVLIEATGVPALVLDSMSHVRPGGIVCLTGVSPTGAEKPVDAGALGRRMVLENMVVFGTVNANRGHYEQAAAALAAADRGWLESLITRRVGLDDAAGVLTNRSGEIKVAIELGSD